jgi:GntR family transcriptional regulator
VRPLPTGPVRPETLYQRSRQTPDRLNNSMRRTYDLLRSTLQNGQSDQSLVEGELTEALSASRNTVRAVLQQLAKEGLVTRSPKRGTRSAGSLMLRINNLSPVREFGGGDSSIRTELRTLEYRTLGGLRMVRDRLRIPPGWTVLMIESLLVQDNEPLGISVSYIALHPDQCYDLQVEEPDPILFLERQLDIKIAGSRTTIGATAADEQSAALVGVELGAPMIFLEDILEDESGQPRALSQFRMRSDRIAFTACASRSA